MEKEMEEKAQRGRIVVRVQDKDGAQAPIVGAKVNIYISPAQDQDKPEVKRRKHDVDLHQRQPEFICSTNSAGRLEQECNPASYILMCEAFGLSDTQEVEVQSGCPCEVILEIPVGLELKSYITREDCGPYVPCDVVTSGIPVIWKVESQLPPAYEARKAHKYTWRTSQGFFIESPDARQRAGEVHLRTAGLEGEARITVTLSENPSITVSGALLITSPRVTNVGGGLSVSLRRTATAPTPDLPLWVIIKKTAEAVSFNNYSRFMDLVLCGTQRDLPLQDEVHAMFGHLRNRRFLPFNDTDAYRLLKVATEAFLMVNCGVVLKKFDPVTREEVNPFTQAEVNDLISRVSLDRPVDVTTLNDLWQGPLGQGYLQLVNGGPDATLPYLALIRDKLQDVGIKASVFAAEDPDINPDISLPQGCFGILRTKLTNPCLLELIWSYWHEEGMLVQTLNAISRRFQNVRRPEDRDPLAMLEIDPLRPLNNLLWGYLQDEQHRLSVPRRVYEYGHHYGLSLYGKAVPEIRTADGRSKFLEAFHNLLYLSSIFFKQDDDTTVIADGFPVLNAIREVHFLLSEGAHNQFGDLPSTARQEMLIQQWLLGRPEFREFLPTRIMVAYPERWMDRVDAMKTLQGWTDVSVTAFHDLGTSGEQILLSVRFGAWSTVNDPVQAANWARFWRAEIQNYIHSYRAVTGVDLTSDVTDAKQATARYLQPSVHLRTRLAIQKGVR